MARSTLFLLALFFARIPGAIAVRRGDAAAGASPPRRRPPHEPAWCSNKEKCTLAKKTSCPVTCGENVPAAGARLNQSSPRPDTRKIPIVKVHSGMKPLELIRVMKTAVYKKMWPIDCAGSTSVGSQTGVNTDGFKCLSRDGSVAELVNFLWKQERQDICCDKQCVKPNRCPAPSLTFVQAAQKVAASESFKVRSFRPELGEGVENITKDGVQVETFVTPPEEVANTGVHAVVEVRMLESSLRFFGNEATLKPEGIKFFEELNDPLGALITMQMMAFPDINAGVLLCAHGSTTKQRNQIAKHKQSLPKERASVIRDLLSKAIPSESWALLGDPIGHYAYEVADFEGGRFGSIIYKIFDADRAVPSCQKRDLYPFVVPFVAPAA